MVGLFLWQLRLLQQPGTSLEVRSVPTGAEILVDGRPLGKTDGTFLGLQPGGRELEVRHDGFRSVRRKLDLRAGEDALVALELAPEPGRCSLSVAGPARYTVTVGPGVPETWKNPGERKLDPGLYELTVTADGYLPASKTVRVESGRLVAASFRLEEIPRPQPPPVSAPAPPVRAPAEPPAYRPPPAWTPPPRTSYWPRPAPRITAVPPPRPSVPEPIFTPIP